MKKLLTLFLVLIVGFALASCETVNTYEIAMITDAGDIDDKSLTKVLGKVLLSSQKTTT